MLGMPLNHAIQSVDQDTSLLSLSTFNNVELKVILREMNYQLEVLEVSPPEPKIPRLPTCKKTVDGANVQLTQSQTDSGGAHLSICPSIQILYSLSIYLRTYYQPMI